MDEFADFYGQLDPETLQQIMGLGAIPEQQHLLDQQMALAQQLRKPGPERSSPLGAAFQGIGDIASNYQAGNMMRGAQAGQRDLAQQGTQGRMAYMRALADFLRSKGGGAAAPAAPVVGLTPGIV